MKVAAIAAMAKNRVIGTENKLPWHLPEDLKFFKEKTLGRIIIMGRKTFESVGSKPMPKRLTVVVTRQDQVVGATVFSSAKEAFEFLSRDGFEAKTAFAFRSIEAALDFSREVISKSEKWEGEAMICGGEEIYKLAMPYTDKIYLTVINQDFTGDAKFPDFSLSEFKLIEKSDRSEPLSYSFHTYSR